MGRDSGDSLGHAPVLHCALAVLGSLAVALWAQWPGLFHHFVINDDARQQLYWMQRWLDPALYPQDVLGDYARCYVPWGVQGLYRAGALFLNPLDFSKWVAVALLTFQGTFVFLLARRLADEATAVLALGLFWLMPCFMENISGGLARAFAAPLLTLFLYALAARRRWLAHAALLGQALFIPYILPICLGAACLHFAAWRVRLVEAEPVLRRVPDVLLSVLALGLAVAWQAQMAQAGFGPLPWAAEMAGRPEFGPKGRFAMLPVPSLMHELVVRPLGSLAPFREAGPWAGAAALCILMPAVGLGLWRSGLGGLRRLGAGLGFAALSSLCLYVAARLLLLKLFIPSRYLEYTVNVLYLVALAVLLGPLLLSVVQRRGRCFGAALLALAMVGGAARQHGYELYDYSGGQALYAAVGQLPKDARLGGHPALMDTVLTFGQRNVHASFELAHPWSQGYWRQVGPRLEGMLRAYYAADFEDARRYCQQAGIDFLVVDRRHFTREFMTRGALFEPLDNLVRQRSDDPAPFALLSDTVPGVAVDAETRLVDMRP